MADKDALEFWDDFEKETGEKVIARSMGEWFKAKSDPGLWGLLILTDKSFRFKYMPSENWMMSIFKRAAKSAKKDEAFDIVIPREGIRAIASPKRDFLARLFGPAFPRFSISASGEEGETSYSFTADPSSGIVEALASLTSRQG